MPSQFTTSLRLELQANGENDTTWGDIANRNFRMIDAAISGRVDITMNNADKTLSTSYNGDDESRAMLLIIGGTLSAARNLIIPAVSKQYIVRNITAGNFPVTVKTVQGTGVVINNGETRMVVCDGGNVYATGAGADARVSPSGMDTATQTWRVNGAFGVGRDEPPIPGYGTFAADGTLGSTYRFYANGQLVGSVTGQTSGVTLESKSVPLIFGVNGSIRMRFNSSSNTNELWGDTSVAGSVSAVHGAFSGDIFGRSMKITSSAPYITFDDTDTNADRQLVFNGGLFGFALSNGNWGAYCDDTGNWTAAGTLNMYSDERKKKDWENVDKDFIEKLAGVLAGTYTDIETNERRAGVGAQHLQAVVPEAVKETVGGYLTVNHGGAALLACVELAREVCALRAEIESLKAAK